MRHLLVAGVTTRALAVSAARAGWRVTAVDAFGDLDLRAVATVASAAGTHGKRFSPAAKDGTLPTILTSWIKPPSGPKTLQSVSELNSK